MGNSEVGHLNLGAGRIVAQDLVRICDAVADGSLASQPGAAWRPSPRRVPAAACCTWPGSSPTAACTRTSTTCARSSAAALARRRAACRRARLHGRPRRLAPPGGGPARAARAGVGRHGRGRSRPSSGATTRMDRDHRVERTELARAAIVDGVGERARVGVGRRRGAAMRAGLTDEFVKPDRARRRRAAHRAGRSARVLQLPARPRAPDLPRARCRRSGCSSR